MDGFEKVSKFMENMQDTAVRYADYQRVSPAQIEYHEVKNDDQLTLVKKAGSSNALVILVVLLAFAATGIFSIVTGSIPVGVLLLAFVGLLTYFYLPAVTGKPMVKEGKAIWKQARRTGPKRRKGSNHTYFVTIIFESPEKTLCQLVQTNKRDYEEIVEGTPMLLIKKGNMFYACVDRTHMTDY